MNTLNKIYFIVGFMVFLSTVASGDMITIEPDAFADGTDISTAFSSVTLSSHDSAWPYRIDGSVYARTASNPLHASTGTKIFGTNATGTDSEGNPLNESWINYGPMDYWIFCAHFNDLANYVSIDVINNDGINSDVGELSVWDAGSNFLGQVWDSVSGRGTSSTLVFNSSSFDIAYIEFKGTSSVAIDNFKANVVPVPGAMLLGMLGLGAAGLKLRKFA